jgi:hypothetical protein
MSSNNRCPHGFELDAGCPACRSLVSDSESTQVWRDQNYVNATSVVGMCAGSSMTTAWAGAGSIAINAAREWRLKGLSLKRHSPKQEPSMTDAREPFLVQALEADFADCTMKIGFMDEDSRVGAGLYVMVPVSDPAHATRVVAWARTQSDGGSEHGS